MPNPHPDANPDGCLRSTFKVTVVTAADSRAWIRSQLFVDPPGAFVDSMDTAVAGMAQHRIRGADLEEQVAEAHSAAVSRWLPRKKDKEVPC